MNPVVWYVIFHPKQKKHWWARRFGHVSLAGWCNETWVHIDLNRATTEVQTYFAHDEVADYLSHLSAYTTMVKFGVKRESHPSFWHPLTCVSFVKHTLGIRSRALLPDGLFKILVSKYDAEIVNERRCPTGNRSPETSAGPC